MKRFICWRLACVALLWALGLTGAYADRALVVGVDDYPALPGARLSGCRNDAAVVGRALAADGFEVTVLNDATRSQMLQALANMRTRCRTDERFVFFFAGHGSGPRPAVILPSDTRDPMANVIEADELRSAVAAIPARSRTVLLDSCFSGAMLLAKGVRLGGRARFYEFQHAPSKDLTLVNEQDTNDHLQPAATEGAPAICYFVAARRNETALEKVIGDVHHGVFSYYLARHLRPGLRWDDLQARVSTAVVDETDNCQHPTLTPQYEALMVFGGEGAAPPAKPIAATTLWDIYNRDSVDHARLKLTLDPDRTVVKVGEHLHITVQMGQAGYLILVEHGVSGRANLLYPGKAGEPPRLAAGAVIRIPHMGQAYAPDAPGTERIRAVLCSSKDLAAHLLAALREAGAGRGVEFAMLAKSMRTRDLTLSAPHQTCTADLNFEVVP
jgi:uncharacterized caspase-like protein